MEVSCYASVDEISKEIEPLMSHYFPAGAEIPLKVHQLLSFVEEET